MSLNNRLLQEYGLRQQPKTPIKIKKFAGYIYDPVTNKQIPQYSITDIFGYVGYFDGITISHSNNKLSYESRKVIIPKQDISISDIIEIGGKEYKIDTLEIKQGICVLGVNEK